MNTGKLEQATNIINKIPRKVLYAQDDDIFKVRSLYNYLLQKYSDEIKFLDNNVLVRALILKQLTLINMKVTNVNILILNGLNVLNPRLLNLESSELARLLVNENTDYNDLTTIEKCISQVKARLPEYLKERFNRKNEIAIMEILYNILPEAEKLARQDPPKLRPTGKEPFTDDSPLTPRPSQSDMYDASGKVDYARIDTVGEVTEFHRLLELYRQEKGTYPAGYGNDDRSNEIIKKYFADHPEEANMFEMEIKDLMQDSSYSAQEKQFIRDKLIEEKIKIILLNKDLEHGNVKDLELEFHAEYVDRDPTLMLDPKTNKHFYYDSQSRTLKMLPEGSKMKPVSLDDVEKLLKDKKIDQSEIDKTLVYLKNDQIGANDDYLLKSDESDAISDKAELYDKEKVKSKKELSKKKQDEKKGNTLI